MWIYNGKQRPLGLRGDKRGYFHPASHGQSGVTNGYRHYAGWLSKRAQPN